MTAVLQLRRGTAAEHTTFTGATGEITYDTTDKRPVMHDGSTAGGIPVAKESELAGYQPVDADLTAIAALTTTAAGRSILEFSDPNADRVAIWDDSAGAFVGATLTPNIVISGTELRVIETHIIAASDETTALTTGTNKATFALPYAFTVTEVGASVNTVSSSGTPTIDINEAGTTILSTKITIDVSEKTSLTAAAAAVISDSSIAAGAEIGIDIDTAGTGTKGLKVWIRGYPT